MHALTRELIAQGLSPAQVEKISHALKNTSPEQSWQAIVAIITAEKYPFSLHEFLYKNIYPQWETMPAPAWFPDSALIATTHLAQWMQEKKFTDYTTFHQWSVKYYRDFWQMILQKLKIIFDQPFSTLVDLTAGITALHWFPHAKLNIAKSCFQADKSHIAIISQNAQGEYSKTTYDELDKLSNRVANSLNYYFNRGDRIAMIMPMTKEAVAIYLGIIKFGASIVAIPDSFSAEEIAIRLKIANAKGVFCQDNILREGKLIPLYARVIDAKSIFNIVIPAEQYVSLTLIEKDITWENFLKEDEHFIPVSCDPEDEINILFSSGTTGQPKAIAWNHTSPIKCGSDGYLHHDIQPNDIFCWPTNLGWMMGPWLIFATLLNKATIALYENTPNGESFGKFIQEARVTILGVVPTMVRTWRHSRCMEKSHWDTIKLFTSTGERSNVEDMLYLMSLAHYKPIIEYCGGTEISGAYITSTLLQPSAPAAFTTPALGLDFMLLDEQGKLTNKGEVAIIPPSIGLSTTLLNKNHYEVYYDGMPVIEGIQLRRHGDEIRHYPNGYYRLLGRVDDTMKLGGIKISSAEIENLLNRLPTVYETAAIAVNPQHGGPSLLVIYAVLKPHEKNTAEQLKVEMQQCIKENLNPLFKIHDVVIVNALPRTASNKVMRRALRDN